MKKEKIAYKIKHSVFIGIVLGASVSIARAEIDMNSPEYLAGFSDGLQTGKDIAANRLVKLVSGTLKERRLFYAVALTESQGKTKHEGGKIPIRFEHKWFKRCLNRKGVKTSKIPKTLRTHVNRYKKVNGKWKSKGINEYKWIKLAKSKGWSYCAHWATSYGNYQIMGFNHKEAGFSDPISMSDAYHANRTEKFNYKHFIIFIKNYRGGKAYRELMRGHLTSFAKTYNGSKKYAVKLRKNLKKAKKAIKS